jgi:indolepyruvate ferredoxin oxidoreductase alpha subunit
MREEIFLGNGAVALGLLEGGCRVATSYPGTPSSEILPELVRLRNSADLDTYVEWSTNEKVALDNAFAAAISGKRAACCMKQVGLNVAADSLMSASYTGTIGGFLIISCDDPGPHSSQTEQDTRLMARLAKVPVLDPSDPAEAREMARSALELSEEFKIPVVLRPTIRVCHARQNLAWEGLQQAEQRAVFKKEPTRWAATPKFRYLLHGQLNEKLDRIAKRFGALLPFNRHNLTPDKEYPFGLIAGGVSFAVVHDILEETGRHDIPVLKIGAPYPFPEDLVARFLKQCRRVLVVEETDAFIEYLLRDRQKVLGRLSGDVPSAGELTPQVVYGSINGVLRKLDLEEFPKDESGEVSAILKSLELPVRKPTLCPGCPHRAAFYAIKKYKPKAIFTSDIGCYTLGLNLGAVDTCLDMGAAITLASGLYHAFEQDGTEQSIIATIGDSTFYHSGTAGLLNAVYNDARFILVILDNGTTAMTGMQPTPASGVRADGTKGNAIALERVVAGCGIDFIEVVDPYDLKRMRGSLKRADAHVRSTSGGIAVVIARHPCVIAYRGKALPEAKYVTVTEDCKHCSVCIERFECPALYMDESLERAAVNMALCSGCGVCVQVCPKGAIVEITDGGVS